jgi:hypothetical protein
MTTNEQMAYVMESHLRERMRLGSGEVIAIAVNSALDDGSTLESEWMAGTIIHHLDRETA